MCQHPLALLYFKNQTIKNDSNDVEKLVPPCTAVGNVKQCSHCIKSLAVPHKLRITYVPAISLLAIYPRELKKYGYTKICTQMLTAALFTIGKR